MEPLFTYADATRTFWFNMNCKDEYDLRLVGVIIGLAIYNGVILDVHFPLIVYKKLVCGRSVMEDRADDAHACSNQTNFEDLREAMPELWRSLNALLEYDGDVETDLCLTFELSYECLGGVRTVELLPGGATIPVTAENRTQYVYLYTDFMLNRSVEAQFLAFKQGFEQVCGGPALSLFRPEELELLVCGLPHLDFVALERVATYEGGYHAHHPLILRFWSVLHAFSLELKKRFLFVNNALPPKMLARLERDFDLKPELGLGDVYLRAFSLLEKPFSLSAMNSKAMTTEQQILATM